MPNIFSVRGRRLLIEWIERSRVATNREAAKALELDETWLSQFLSGKRKPGLATAVELELKTGIPVRSWTETELGEMDEELASSGKRSRVGRS